MPVFLLSLAGKLGIPPQFRQASLIAAGVVLLIIAAFAVVKIHDHRVVVAHEAQLQQQAQKANNQAASERANDTIANAKSEQEMHNAVQAQPDQPIAPTSHALSCERLRRLGRAPASCR